MVTDDIICWPFETVLLRRTVFGFQNDDLRPGIYELPFRKGHASSGFAVCGKTVFDFAQRVRFPFADTSSTVSVTILHSAGSFAT